VNIFHIQQYTFSIYRTEFLQQPLCQPALLIIHARLFPVMQWDKQPPGAKKAFPPQDMQCNMPEICAKAAARMVYDPKPSHHPNQ
jgi:hypothetical protein